MTDSRNTLASYAGRRAAHAALTTIISLPIWVFFRGGFAETLSISFLGFLLGTAIVLFVLLLISDLILDAFLGGRNRTP